MKMTYVIYRGGLNLYTNDNPFLDLKQRKDELHNLVTRTSLTLLS